MLELDNELAAEEAAAEEEPAAASDIIPFERTSRFRQPLPVELTRRHPSVEQTGQGQIVTRTLEAPVWFQQEPPTTLVGIEPSLTSPAGAQTLPFPLTERVLEADGDAAEARAAMLAYSIEGVAEGAMEREGAAAVRESTTGVMLHRI